MFNTGLCRSVFSTIAFGKLVFRLFVLSMFFVLNQMFWMKTLKYVLSLFKKVLSPIQFCSRYIKVNALNFIGLVLSWVLWVPCHRAFVGPKSFLVGISRVRNFFSWVFRGHKISSRGCFVGPRFFSRGYFVGTLWLYQWGIWINKCHTPLINLESVTLKNNCFQFLYTPTLTWQISCWREGRRAEGGRRRHE